MYVFGVVAETLFHQRLAVSGGDGNILSRGGGRDGGQCGRAQNLWEEWVGSSKGSFLCLLLPSHSLGIIRLATYGT